MIFTAVFHCLTSLLRRCGLGDVIPKDKGFHTHRPPLMSSLLNKTEIWAVSTEFQMFQIAPTNVVYFHCLVVFCSLFSHCSGVRTTKSSRDPETRFVRKVKHSSKLFCCFCTLTSTDLTSVRQVRSYLVFARFGCFSKTASPAEQSAALRDAPAMTAPGSSRSRRCR